MRHVVHAMEDRKTPRIRATTKTAAISRPESGDQYGGVVASARMTSRVAIQEGTFSSNDSTRASHKSEILVNVLAKSAKNKRDSKGAGWAIIGCPMMAKICNKSKEGNEVNSHEENFHL